MMSYNAVSGVGFLREAKIGEMEPSERGLLARLLGTRNLFVTESFMLRKPQQAGGKTLNRIVRAELTWLMVKFPQSVGQPLLDAAQRRIYFRKYAYRVDSE